MILAGAGEDGEDLVLNLHARDDRLKPGGAASSTRRSGTRPKRFRTPPSCSICWMAFNTRWAT
jgi:hypothetical protein